MNNLLFSVLIANYNNGRYIQQTIESVFTQSYKNWEIVIVDDCSTDNSKEVLCGYQTDKRIRIFNNESNRGCGYTKRRCVEQAQGEICGFLDADDALTPDALEIMARAHSENPDASMIYSRYYACDEKLNVQEISRYQCEIPSGVSFLEYRRGAVSHFVTFKKANYDRTVGINPMVFSAVDYDLYLKLEEVGKLKFIDRPLYYYRRGTGNNISLGDRAHVASYWGIFVMSEACIRRGMNAEKVVYPYFNQEISYAARSLYESSWQYRMWSKMKSPVRFLLRLFRRG